jgi:hypothetical protein
MSSDTPSRGFPGSSIEDAGDKEGNAGTPRDRLAEDVSSLRADITKMHESFSTFVSVSGHVQRAIRGARCSGRGDGIIGDCHVRARFRAQTM